MAARRPQWKVTVEVDRSEPPLDDGMITEERYLDGVDEDDVLAKVEMIYSPYKWRLVALEPPTMTRPTN